MSSYRVQEPPRHSLPLLPLVAAALVFAAVLSVGMRGLETVPVSIDGQTVDVPLGATVADVLDADLVSVSRGDIVDADGAVLAMGRGESGAVLVNGAVVPGSFRLSTDDRITVITGADVPESIVTTVEPIPITIDYEGKGPLVGLASPGAVGVREITYGEVSRRVVESTVVVQVEPMVLRRYAPDPGNKIVALTFDDGPWPGSTEQICKILEDRDITGNFFMLGIQVRRNPGIAKRVAEGGHLIGNHSWGHVYLRAASPQLARSEIENAQIEIEKTVGVTPTWYRPAGGIVSPAVWAQTRESGVRLITWNVDPEDYRTRYVMPLVDKVVNATKPGSVILLHDGGGDRHITVTALPVIIQRLQDKGYSFVTLDEMYPEQ